MLGGCNKAASRSGSKQWGQLIVVLRRVHPQKSVRTVESEVLDGLGNGVVEGRCVAVEGFGVLVDWECWFK